MSNTKCRGETQGGDTRVSLNKVVEEGLTEEATF